MYDENRCESPYEARYKQSVQWRRYIESDAVIQLDRYAVLISGHLSMQPLFVSFHMCEWDAAVEKEHSRSFSHYEKGKMRSKVFNTHGLLELVSYKVGDKDWDQVRRNLDSIALKAAIMRYMDERLIAAGKYRNRRF